MSTAFSRCPETNFAAVYPDARNPHAFPEPMAEGPRPWLVPELWLADSPSWLLAEGRLAEEFQVVDTR